MPDERSLARPRATLLTQAVRVLSVAAILAVLPQRGTAVSDITVDVGDIQGRGWSARDVRVALELPGALQTIARIHARRITLLPEFGALERVTVTCRNPIVKEPVFSCRAARVTGNLGRLGRQQFTANVAYHSERKTLTFSIDGLKVGQGRASLRAKWLESGWDIEAHAEKVPLVDLRQLAAPWFELPEDLTVAGLASLNVAARGATDIASVRIEGQLAEISANNAEGTLAAEKLGVTVDTELVAAGPDWDIRATLESSTGQAYSDPIFVDLGQNPVRAALAGRWSADASRIQIERLDVDAKGIAAGRATGELDLAGKDLLKEMRVELERVEFPGAFATLMQPFLLDTDIKDLKMTGRVSGVLEIVSGMPAAFDLAIHDVGARGSAITMQALRGRVNWLSAARRAARADGAVEPAPSRLEWNESTLYGISGGAAHIDFTTSGSDFRLLEATVIPILDGGLAVDTLSIRGFGEPGMSVRFDGDVHPISVPLLCKAFGWPEFSGKLEGRIPEVTFDNDVLSLAGDLEARIFDGQVVVDSLKLENPLGDYPRFSANLTMRNLDLEAVTGTFAFGMITGRLHADVRNLELFRWAPVRFDARLYTPPGDKSRHLISQRAVKNLSNIGGGSGGGVAVALQSGFLRFFENFRYSRLGLSCRLENEICEMDGIEPQKGDAYYIVKGSGLPRIDIIGNAHRVSWKRLVSQLVAIKESGAPIVE
jgi:hypothetical protein